LEYSKKLVFVSFGLGANAEIQLTALLAELSNIRNNKK
jgi:hypothetical protein